MIPFWVRWVDLAQFPGQSDAAGVQQWLADEGIMTRLRAHRQERGQVGTSVGFQILPDQTPGAYLYTVEVHRDDLDRAHEALARHGWRTEDYERHWWLSQSLVIGGFALSVVIVVGLVVAFALTGETP